MGESEAIVVFITAPTRAEAVRLAETLVEAKLAACVQILPEIESIYRWQGKIEHQQEVLVIAKTSSVAFEALEARVRATHSYDTPEIVAVPVTIGSQPYLDWIAENVDKREGNS